MASMQRQSWPSGVRRRCRLFIGLNTFLFVAAWGVATESLKEVTPSKQQLIPRLQTTDGLDMEPGQGTKVSCLSLVATAVLLFIANRKVP